MRAGPVVAVAACLGVLLAACAATTAGGRPGTISVVAAENEYANVVSQIGGRYVSVSAVMSNPAADPHSLESTPQIAELVSGAQLVVQNGLGYDEFMTKIEDAVPSSNRKVIDVQSLLGLPSTTPNPHLWYEVSTMPRVAAAAARDLSELQPAHAQYFRSNLERFDQSLRPWKSELARVKARFAGVKVASTEPVADYLIQAAGLVNATPFQFQADVMNGVDPAPQDVSLLERLLSSRAVKAFVYNRQVTDSLTVSLLALAQRYRVPVVGVYETMPTPGYDYQSWMLAATRELWRALADGSSSPTL